MHPGLRRDGRLPLCPVDSFAVTACLVEPQVSARFAPPRMAFTAFPAIALDARDEGSPVGCRDEFLRDADGARSVLHVYDGSRVLGIDFY